MAASDADVLRLMGFSRKSYRVSFSLLSIRMRKRSKSPNMGPWRLPTRSTFFARTFAISSSKEK